MAKKEKENKALEKKEEKEEKLHKDLDGDGEKGESAAHRKKVFGGKAVKGEKKFPVKKKK